MRKVLAWWFKHTLLIMAFTTGLYVLGQFGGLFAFLRFHFKILLMLLIIETTPLGAVAGWLLRQLAHLFSAIWKKLIKSRRQEL